MRDILIAHLALLQDDMNFLVELPLGLTIVFQKNAGPFAEENEPNVVTESPNLYDFSFYAANCPLHDNCECYEHFIANNPDPDKLVDEFIKRLGVPQEALEHVIRFK